MTARDFVKSKGRHLLSFNHAEWLEMMEEYNQLYSQTSIATALKDWIQTLSFDERNKEVYASREKNISWTFDDILREITERSDEGIRIEKNVIQLTLDLITRGKRQIVD